MSLADLRRQNSKQFVNLVAEKTKKIQKQQTTRVGKSLADKIRNICDSVQDKLGKYANDFICITTVEQLKEYIDVAIKNNIIAIDTETTGLDPITDQIVGVCIYTPTMKPAYIPINHICYVTNVRLDNQLTNNQVKECFLPLLDNNVQIIYFNAKFDIRVMRHQLGIDLPPAWDGFIAGKVLKEDEEEGNLKYLWKKYCSKNKDEAHFTFDKMFEGIKFNLIPINTAYLYAAKDALMTYELYEFQRPYLTPTDEKCIECDFTRLAYVYNEIELPIISVIADIEDNGICLDKYYAKNLSEKYHKLMDEKVENFYNILQEYEDKIISYKATHPNTKLQDKINISSPVQLSELLYDVMEIPSVSKKDPKGTGVDILKAIDNKYNNPICKAILEYRNVEKLLSTYIDKLPEIVNKKTNKIHCSFNQYGADTGRFSSNNPNLQNIPSKNKDIRKMFVASENCVLIGNDFSQQEPKLTADMSNDEQFIKDCASGKDAYGTIASIAFNKPYEECLEFYLDENGNKTNKVNKEGKERRSISKIILLGICYGKSMKSIAEDLNVSEEKATEIYNAVLTNIPGLKNFMIESQEMAKNFGWVETKWGRRRHIPEMQLPQYDVIIKGNKNFDPFFDSKELGVIDDTDRLKQKYIDDLLNAKYYKQKQQIKEKAEKDGFKIIDNTRTISDAERQCVNSRVQGSAADQSKIAIRLIGENKRLKELGFKMLLLVHDEIIGECPIQNVKECRDIFTECMINSANDLRTGAKCDASVVVKWYGEELDIDNLTVEQLKEKVKEEKCQN